MSKHTQHIALQQYLNALLDDESEAALQRVSSSAPSELSFLDEPQSDLLSPVLPLREPLFSDEELERLPVSIPIAETVQIETMEISAPPTLDETLKQVAWSDVPFECLLFDVAGLTLAVPLAALGSIYSFKPTELTPIFAQPDWFIGLLPAQSGNLKVLETARWVMPERYTADMREDLSYVISINGFDWGLAVHQVRNAIRLEPHQVKWLTQRGQRSWLAGTVIEHMCALLDVEVLAKLISQPATV